MALFGRGKKKDLLDGLDDLLRTRLRALVEKDPEFRALLRHAIREHLEVMRDELVSLDKANQALAEAYQGSLEVIDDLVERVRTLEKIIVDGRALPKG